MIRKWIRAKGFHKSDLISVIRRRIGLVDRWSARQSISRDSGTHRHADMVVPKVPDELTDGLVM